MTKDEHDNFVLQEEEDDQELVEEEFEDYHKSHLNAMMDLQRQYNLRTRNVVVDPPKKAPKGQALASQPTKNQPRREMVQQKPAQKYFPKASPSKEKELPKESIPKEKDLHKEEIKKELLIVESPAPHFNMQNEISKIKISVPYNEILRNIEYKGHLSKMIKSEDSSYSLNL